MNNNVIKNGKIIIKSLIFSKPIKEYIQYHQKFSKLAKINDIKLQSLQNKVQKILKKLNHQGFKLPVIIKWLNCCRNKRLQKYQHLIAAIINNKHKNKALCYNVWMEILTHYPIETDNNHLPSIINFEKFKMFQNELIEDCQLLENEFPWLLAVLEPLHNILLTLVDDIGNDEEFRKNYLLKVISNNQFLSTKLEEINEDASSGSAVNISFDFSNIKEEINEDVSSGLAVVTSPEMVNIVEINEDASFLTKNNKNRKNYLNKIKNSF